LKRGKRENGKTDAHKKRVIPISMGYIYLIKHAYAYPKPEIKEEKKAIEQNELKVVGQRVS